MQWNIAYVPDSKGATWSLEVRDYIRPLTSALAETHQAGEAKVSLAMTEAQKIVWSFFSLMPFDRRIRSAYSDCPEDARTSDTWSAIEKLFVSVTPRIFRVVTRVTPANSGTMFCDPRLLGFQKMISYDFLQLRLRLFLDAQVWTCWISIARTVDILGWDDKICIVREFKHFIPFSIWVKVGCSHVVRCRSKSGSLDKAGRDELEVGFVSRQHSPMGMSGEEWNYPVVDTVRLIQRCKFLREGWVSNCVEGFAEIQRNDYHVWILYGAWLWSNEGALWERPWLNLQVGKRTDPRKIALAGDWGARDRNTVSRPVSPIASKELGWLKSV